MPSSCPRAFIYNQWVRVAVDVESTPIAFSVVIPTDGLVHELDGLFVEPAHMSSGLGRALIRTDDLGHSRSQSPIDASGSAGP